MVVLTHTQKNVREVVNLSATVNMLSSVTVQHIISEMSGIVP